MDDKKAIREEIIKRAREDKDFYNRLISNPESIISELRINNTEIEKEILSITPEEFDKLFKNSPQNYASCSASFTVCLPN